MAYETEEEQVEKIKDMWRRHGMPLLTGVAIALAGVFGWQAWNNYQDTQARNASTLYQSMLESVLASDSEASRARAAELAAQVREEYASTRYADYAALMQARLAVEAKDFAVAEQSLREVMDGSKNVTLQEGAELRATREEIRGDLLLTLGRGDEAREAYKAAKEALEDASARPQLQLKLDDLAEEA